MLDLPSRIKIGGHWWVVKSDAQESARLNEEAVYGLTSEKHFSISVDANKCYERQAETLLHEIYHAVEATWLTPKDRSIEPVAKANTAGLLQVLRDNPEVVKFILGDPKD